MNVYRVTTTSRISYVECNDLPEALQTFIENQDSDFDKITIIDVSLVASNFIRYDQSRR